MNSHKNARLTLQGRKLLIQRITTMGLSSAATACGVSLRTARKWRRRYEQAVPAGLLEHSFPPTNP